jgi:CheY-like chemotaxis protein
MGVESEKPDDADAVTSHDVNDRSRHTGSRRTQGREVGVLIADDDPVVRDAIRRGLVGRGFAVWVCADGREAVNAYRTNAAQIDVVLLDVHMPILDGPAASTELRAIDPAIRICFMTGDAGDQARHRLMEHAAAFVFCKPFTSIGDVANTLAGIACSESNATEGISTPHYSHRPSKTGRESGFSIPEPILFRLIQWPALHRSTPTKQGGSGEKAD